MPTFFATCAKNLENILREELTSFGAENIKETVAGVYFEGDLSVAYRACLWSRVANHVLLQLAQFDAPDEQALYDKIQEIDWSEHLNTHGSLAIEVTGHHPTLTHTLYTAQRVKDAIVDQFRDKTGERPSVENFRPNIVLNLHTDWTLCTLNLSLSGESLHRRGYHLESGKAPLKETLAAAILIRAGWLKELAKPNPILLDPMCGTATFLIEAALMAFDIAPGSYRNYFGFFKWKQHQPELWDNLIQEAESRKITGLTKQNIKILGSDIHRQAVSKSLENINHADLSDRISITLQDCARLTNPFLSEEENPTGLIICNPPYGERMEPQDLEAIKNLFVRFGEVLKNQFMGWNLGVFSGAPPECTKAIGIRSKKSYVFLNGMIPCQLYFFNLQPELFLRHETPEERQTRQIKTALEHGLSEAAQMFQNRLLKNLKHFKKQLQNPTTPLFRIYDRDLPDYAVMIDLEITPEGIQKIHVQEYQAPSSIDPKKVSLRLKEVLAVLHQALDISSEKIIVNPMKQLTRSMQKYQERK